MFRRQLLALSIATLIIAVNPLPLLAAVVFQPYLPAGSEVQRGAEFIYTIDIDTGGETISNVSAGVRYDKTYLEFERVDQGDTLTISEETLSDDGSFGRIGLVGTNSSGFNGTGNFANVVFRLRDDVPESGYTEICSMFDYQPPNPTSPPNSPYQPPPGQPTAVPYQPQQPQQPGSLVVRNTPPGDVLSTQTAGVLGAGLLMFGLVSFAVMNIAKRG